MSVPPLRDLALPSEDTLTSSNLAGTGKGGQLGGYQHGGHIFHLQLGQRRGRQGEAELLHVVAQPWVV
jgi:hypothetical protein